MAVRSVETLHQGLACFGFFDGSLPSLAAVAPGNRILIHNPHSSEHDSSHDTSLRVKQKVTALAAGCLDPCLARDILFIGTSQAVQAYDVQNNADIFFLDVTEGVNCMVVGTCSKSLHPLLYIGSSLSILGVDSRGKEQLWTVTGDIVQALAAVDTDADGYSELAAGTKCSEILLFKEEKLLHDFKEADTVTNICPLAAGEFAYTLSNCTIGVYRSGCRLWRVKSKHPVNCICSHTPHDSHVTLLISGWENGKKLVLDLASRHHVNGKQVQVEVRGADKGDVLFRQQLDSPVIHTASIDFKQDGHRQVVACLADGSVCGYSSDNQQSIIVQHKKEAQVLEQMLQSLEQRKREYAQELNLVNQNLVDAASSATAANIEDFVPPDTEVTVHIQPNTESLRLDLVVSTSNHCVVKGVVIFAESLFDGESFFVHPSSPSQCVRVPLKPDKDHAVDMLVKVLVGSPTSSIFHVFDMKSSIAAFAMYVPQARVPSPPPSGCVTFSVPDAAGWVQLWLHDQLRAAGQVEPDGSGKTSLLCLHDGSPMVIRYGPEGTGTSVSIMVDSANLAGDILQALVSHLGVTELSTCAHFPKQEALARQVLQTASDGSRIAQRMRTEVADLTFGLKSLLVKAEDARLLRNPQAMKKHYRGLHNLNNALADEHLKRQTKHQELAGHLKVTNSIIQAAARLQLGKYKDQLVASCRKAVQEQDVEALLRAIKGG